MWWMASWRLPHDKWVVGFGVSFDLIRFDHGADPEPSK